MSFYFLSVQDFHYTNFEHSLNDLKIRMGIEKSNEKEIKCFLNALKYTKDFQNALKYTKDFLNAIKYIKDFLND